MISNYPQTTAQIPSRPGMPISGRVLGATCEPVFAATVRGGHVSVKGLAATADFPGNPAWRPPTC